MSLSSQTLTLLIPVYNGAPYLEATFCELEDFFISKPYLREIIFVNDGSTDDTLHILQSYKKRSRLPNVGIVHLEKNQGKGFALQYGLQHVLVEVSHVAFTDVELPYGLSILEDMLAHYEMEPVTAICIGDRTKDTTKKQYSLYRKMFTHVFRLFLPKPVRTIPDTQSGIKMFRKDIADTIFSCIQTNGWVFDVELLLIALRRGYLIHGMRVQVKSQYIKGKGGISFFKHALRILKDILTVHYHDIIGTYKKRM